MAKCKNVRFQLMEENLAWQQIEKDLEGLWLKNYRPCWENTCCHFREH